MMIIKIGGGKTINHEAIMADLGNIQEPYIVVHGANALRDEIGSKLGVETKTIESVSGYTSVLTDKNAMDLFLMTYAGLRNKRLVELAQKHNINAIGLTGMDGGLIKGIRKQAIKAKDGDKVKIIRDDLSGSPVKINVALLELLLSHGYVPVVTPPILSEENEAINTNNDDILGLLAGSLPVRTIIDLFEAPGLLADMADKNSLIKNLSFSELDQAEEKYAGARMKRKLLGVRRAFANGVKRVILADGRIANPIQNALSGQGTTII